MRKLLVAAGVCGAILVAAALTYANPASDTTFNVDATIKPSNSGSKANPQSAALGLKLQGGTKSGTGQPATSTDVNITLPREWRLNTGIWPKSKRCSKAKADAAKSSSVCPKGSKIGKGHVTDLGAGGTIVEEIDLQAFALTTGDLGLFLKADKPVAFAIMLRGKLKGNVIKVAIPKNVQEPAPGIPTAIKLLRFSLKASTKIKGDTRGIMETVGCKSKSWKVIVNNIYRDGKIKDSDKLACKA